MELKCSYKVHPLGIAVRRSMWKTALADFCIRKFHILQYTVEHPGATLTGSVCHLYQIDILYIFIFVILKM